MKIQYIEYDLEIRKVNRIDSDSACLDILKFLFLLWPSRLTDHSSLFYSSMDFAYIVKPMQCLNVIKMAYFKFFRLKKRKYCLFCQSGEKFIYI